MSDTTPLVSVIIPAHNSADFIVEAVKGVLAQTYRNFEIIVIDDGSSDDTQKVLQQFADQIRYIRQDNRGPSAARNAGVNCARGELICFLDADDVWRPDKLALQTEFMAAHPTIGLLFADAEEWEDTTIRKHSIVATMLFGADIVSQVPLQDAFRKLLIENFIPTSTVMIRKACFSKTGLFDEGLPNVEDRDMWLRTAACSEVACLPRVLAKKLSHGANISARTEVALRSRIIVWKKSCSQFPALAPATVYNKLLAEAYQELGYILLPKGDGRGARRCGVASLNHAIRYLVGSKSLFRYRWWLSIVLVPLSFVWWPLVRSVWQVRNSLLGRNERMAPV